MIILLGFLAALVAFALGTLPRGFIKSAWQDGRRITPKKQFWL